MIIIFLVLLIFILIQFSDKKLKTIYGIGLKKKLKDFLIFVLKIALVILFFLGFKNLINKLKLHNFNLLIDSFNTNTKINVFLKKKFNFFFLNNKNNQLKENNTNNNLNNNNNNNNNKFINKIIMQYVNSDQNPNSFKRFFFFSCYFLKYKTSVYFNKNLNFTLFKKKIEQKKEIIEQKKKKIKQQKQTIEQQNQLIEQQNQKILEKKRKIVFFKEKILEPTLLPLIYKHSITRMLKDFSELEFDGNNMSVLRKQFTILNSFRLNTSFSKNIKFYKNKANYDKTIQLISMFVLNFQKLRTHLIFTDLLDAANKIKASTDDSFFIEYQQEFSDRIVLLNNNLEEFDKLTKYVLQELRIMFGSELKEKSTLNLAIEKMIKINFMLQKQKLRGVLVVVYSIGSAFKKKEYQKIIDLTHVLFYSQRECIDTDISDLSQVELTNKTNEFFDTLEEQQN